MKTKFREPVRLRERLRPSGVRSLYLDIYAEGERTNEFLKLYLYPEDSREARARNRETLALAEEVKARRLMEIREGRYGGRAAANVLLFDYLEKIISRKSGTTLQSWTVFRSHLLRYEKQHGIRLREVNAAWVRGFRDYLDHEARAWDIDSRKRATKKAGLGEGTKGLHFGKLKALLASAVKEELIAANPAAAVEGFRDPESRRQYLTLEEVKRLASVPAPGETLGRAFLFSCLTGLRWSDIVALRWSDVQRVPSGTRLVFRQQKTGGMEYLDIAAQAVALMGEEGAGSEAVFPSMPTPQRARKEVAAWVKAAGIDKHISFHCARHSFAVIMLELGTDIYTLSKLLGHRSIETTQIYAKILDKTKQAAVARIPDIF